MNNQDSFVEQCRRKAKSKRRRNIILICVCSVLAVGAVGSVLVYKARQAMNAASASVLSYNVGKVESGEVTQKISGSGSLTPIDQQNEKSGFAATIRSVGASVGDAVKAGDILLELESDEAQSKLDEMENKLEELNKSLAQTEQRSDSLYVRSPAEGRVKLLKAVAGENVEQLGGYICYISTDGKLLVELATQSALKRYDKVKVSIEGETIDGSVKELTDKGCIIEINDNKYTIGQSAECTLEDGTALGSGVVTLSESCGVLLKEGKVASLSVEESSYVYRNGVLLTLSDYPYSPMYETLRDERSAVAEQIEDIRDSVVIKADFDGYVTELPVKAGDEVAQGDALVTLSGKSGYYMDVSIDELDIGDVANGLEGTVTLDAVAGTYNARVDTVSHVGSANNSTTTYTARVVTEDIEGVLPGMSASCTINVSTSGATLKVPVNALQSDPQGSYIYLAPQTAEYGDNLQAKNVKTNELSKVYVQTGMTDGSYTAVTGDIKEGDLILIEVLETTSQYSQTQGYAMPSGFAHGSGEFGGSMPSGGSFPDDGGMPSGGQMPSGDGRDGE